MNERFLEQQLKGWYVAEVDSVTAPASLRVSVVDIPYTTPRRFAFGRSRAWAFILLLALLVAMGVGAILSARPPRPIISVENGLVAFVAPVGQSGLPAPVGLESDLFVANKDGSAVRRLTTGEGQLLLPTWSPDGSRIAFLAADRASVRVTDLSTGAVHLITRVAGFGKDPPFGLAWSPDGTRLLIGEDTSVRIADIGDTGTSGHVGVRIIREHAGFAAWSPDGREVVLTEFAGSFVGSRLIVIDLGGGQDRLLASQAGYWFVDPEWSPDGRWIAFHSDQGIEIVAPSGEQRHVLIPSSQGEIAWSPDGSLLAVTFGAGILTVKPDGGQQVVVVHSGQGDADVSSTRWSPDGSWISFDTADVAGSWTGTWIVRPDGIGRQRIETGPLRTMVFPVPWSWQPIR